MSALFVVLTLIAFVALIFGLFKPDKVIFWKTTKTRKKVLLVYGIAFIVFMIIAGATSDNQPSESKTEETQAVTSTETQTKEVTKEIPKEIGKPDQIQFHIKLKEFEGKYSDAPNELKKSAVYRQFVSFLKSNLKSGRVENWEGKLKKIGTDEGGKKAYIEITSEFSDKKVFYGTHNNELSDLSIDSMISLGSRVYKDIEKLNEDEDVIFSASFIQDPKRGFTERSFTEQGFVEDPEFILRFVSIKKK